MVSISADRDGDFNWALLLPFGGLFIGYLAFAWVQHDIGSLALSAATASVALGYFFATWFVFREQIREDQFRHWLLSNADKIWSGGITHEGVLVTPQTELRSFSCVASLAIVRAEIPTGPTVVGDEFPRFTQVSATIVTFLVGWWSLGGLLMTPIVMLVNLRGGSYCTVTEYLVGLEENGVAARWRAKHAAPPRAQP